ncbi:TPA: peptide chain release factor N(5)-glutamine methyltransferase [bacterium]|nr:peptide chain release factor N(5)-glutamine methyltransferase [bacterium]
MKLKDLVKKYYDLAKTHNKEVNDIKLLFLEILGVNNTSFYLNMENIISEDIIRKIDDAVKMYLEGKPIAYILGYKYFYKDKFCVNENVLIPRNETEELVDLIIKDVKKLKITPTIIDIGCGSGVIGLTLAKYLENSKVYLSDISIDALNVTRINAKNLNVDVTLLQGDMLEPIIKEGIKANIIVSNPPYIDVNEEVDESVLKYEPHLALFAKNNGLEFYEKILKEAYKVVEDEGLIYFEIGYRQKEGIEALIKKYLPNSIYEVIQDIYKNNRMVKIKYKV